MRVLFINKILDRDSVGRMPLGCLYLSSSLKQSGHEVKLVDACDYGRVKRCIKKYHPEALLFSTRTGFHHYYRALNKRLKDEFGNLYSVFGGPHATFSPEIINEDGIDAICRGEGEGALADFLHKKEKEEDYRKTENFWVKEDGEIYRNGVRPLIDAIDAVLFPDRDLLKEYKSVRHFRIRNFIASRGCPYSCSYCFNEPYFSIYENKGRRLRRRGVDNVLEEIEEERRKSPFDIVQFEDDIFGSSTDWLIEFQQQYPQRVGLPFICNMRPELITAETAALLKAAGCISVWVGIESKNEEIRKKILNRNITDRQIDAAVGHLARHEINYVFEIMIGLPASTIHNDLESLEFCMKWKPAYVDSSIYQPYPGTALSAMALGTREWDGDYEKIGDFHETTCLALTSKKEIENLQALFYCIVRYSFLKKCMFVLIKLPLKNMYRFIHVLLKGLVFSTKITPMKINRYYFPYVYRTLFRRGTQKLGTLHTSLSQKTTPEKACNPAVPTDRRIGRGLLI
ncbi:MAG: B12-binding domain-containing radical SAM protein [Candidatus Omnitrophica bacterium]|nr:B12-binding domain-containing radical SAM protein [Candidatus Omnitrophota bacterium]